jgi:hypothetical protein
MKESHQKIAKYYKWDEKAVPGNDYALKVR